MGLYELSVLVHVAAAVFLLSSSVVASPAVRRATQRAHTAQEIRAYLAIGRPLLVLEPVSAILVLASGAYLTTVAGFWTQRWIQVAAAAWVMNAVVAAIFVKPAVDRMTRLAATSTDGPPSEALDVLRRSPRWSCGGDALMATDMAMLYLMTIRPGILGSLLAVAVANVAVVAVRRVRKTSAARPATA